MRNHRRAATVSVSPGHKRLDANLARSPHPKLSHRDARLANRVLAKHRRAYAIPRHFRFWNVGPELYFGHAAHLGDSRPGSPKGPYQRVWVRPLNMGHVRRLYTKLQSLGSRQVAAWQQVRDSMPPKPVGPRTGIPGYELADSGTHRDGRRWELYQRECDAWCILHIRDPRSGKAIYSAQGSHSQMVQELISELGYDHRSIGTPVAGMEHDLHRLQRAVRTFHPKRDGDLEGDR